MKKTYLSKIVSAVVVASTITTLLPLGVSAQWKQNSDSTWSYVEGNQNIEGWKKISDIWYYFNSNGKMNTGWLCDSGKWYYNNDSGVMQTGWIEDNGMWYYLDTTGSMQTGWIKDNGKWYYADNTGAMQTGVIKIDKKTYCLNNSGEMVVGSIKIGDKQYTFDSNGQAVETIPRYDKEFNLNGNILLKSNIQKNNEESNKIILTDVTTPITKHNDKQAPETITENNDNQSNETTFEDKTTQTNTNNDIESNDISLENTTTQANINDSSNETSEPENTATDTVYVNGLPELPKNYSVTLHASAENKILELMNQKRTEAGLSPLTMDDTLLQVARYKSNHMIQYDYFDHTNPDGTKWTSWLQAIGYEYTATGENIAYNTYDPVELFTQWWNSEGHRANMMNPAYNKVGIGVLEGNNKFMGTQEFSN